MIEFERFNTIGPNWNSEKVVALTILAYDKYETLVSFKGNDISVDENRKILDLYFGTISWIKQEHKNKISILPQKPLEFADGVFTKNPNTPCVIISADCLPIVFCDINETMIGIVHTGWRGLRDQIITNMIKLFEVNPSKIKVWIGPGISQKSYKVGKDVLDELLNINFNYNKAFEKGSEEGVYFLDLYKISKMQLTYNGIYTENISGGIWDTFSSRIFHSARRDKENYNRMATIVMLKNK